jgi:CO/xanthine dehydrogenase FAD-binding subunit
MITAYHRPLSIQEALQLISRPFPRTVPLGGGTLLSHGDAEAVEVVDLQALGLNQINKRGSTLDAGATATLEKLREHGDCPAALKTALKLEAPLNLRNMGTLAGCLVTCDGRSSFATALLALNAKLTIMHPKAETISLGDFLPMRARDLKGILISGLEIFLGAKLAFDYVARTRADKPIVAVALAQWPSGRTRLAVGGHGPAPTLAMDGTEAEGLEAAARNAFQDASDPWGSAEYRMDIAATLSRRCLARLGS